MPPLARPQEPLTRHRHAATLALASVTALAVLAGCSPGPGDESHHGPDSPTQATPTPTRSVVWRDDFDGPAGTAPDPKAWRADIGGDGWGNKERQF